MTAIREHLRDYNLVVRLGGDEFLCAMSGTGLPEMHARFRGAAEALGAGEDPAEITTGFAELRPHDTPAELIREPAASPPPRFEARTRRGPGATPQKSITPAPPRSDLRREP